MPNGSSFKANLLRECIRNNKLSQSKVSAQMGLSEKAFSAKMNGITDWKLGEIQKLQAILMLEAVDVVQIFGFEKN